MRSAQILAVSSLLMLAGTVPSLAHAADREGTYGFADIGVTGVSDRSTVDGLSQKDTGHSSSMGLGAGYRVNRNFAVEGDIHSVLKRKIALRDGRSFGNQGVRVSALGIIPIGENFELLGKVSAGVEWSDMSSTASSPSFDDRALVIGLGAGARYWINDRAALRLDVDGLNKGDFGVVGEKHKYRVGSTTLGFQYRF
ncbi:outer membrane beta-barrel protein [Stenotrophomonas sp. SORGH_AS_0321]|uniref:outer membrane beta-barrel protein n=1 Tax=Stenotrophomonas sp. SORGH_AS_0321 TaxID=3041787 RepID=UPI002859CE28|nr:outer membrane beta-barrel protein [Stenotrophomonas sp. SORGH_AS_0321]MDR6094855.1 OOP family OmpA-OmpF porin [Stenotrophomonas sp. SORGH_AS_0321]